MPVSPRSLSPHLSIVYGPTGSTPESPPIKPMPWMAGDGKAATPQKQEQEQSPFASVVPVPVATEAMGAAAAAAVLAEGGAATTVVPTGGGAAALVEPDPVLAVPFC